MDDERNKPWWKKHPLATAALGTAGLAGGGLLADKLLNDGKLTSQLFNSAKPAEAPNVIPQTAPTPYKPAWNDDADAAIANVNAIGSKDNRGNYTPPTTPSGFDRVVGPASGATTLGALGTALGSKLPGAVGNWSGGASKLMGPAAMVAGPVMDYEAWKNDSPLWRKAVGDYYGTSDSTAGNLLGATGGATSAAVNWFSKNIPVVGPAASAAIMQVPKGVETMLNNSERDLHFSNESGRMYDNAGRMLLRANQENNLPEIKALLTKFPDLKNNLNLENMPQRARMFQEVQSKIQ
jgi:hypothetical protein